MKGGKPLKQTQETELALEWRKTANAGFHVIIILLFWCQRELTEGINREGRPQCVWSIQQQTIIIHAIAFQPPETVTTLIHHFEAIMRVDQFERHCNHCCFFSPFTHDHEKKALIPFSE
jgi:hypothetical protein